MNGTVNLNVVELPDGIAINDDEIKVDIGFKLNGEAYTGVFNAELDIPWSISSIVKRNFEGWEYSLFERIETIKKEVGEFIVETFKNSKGETEIRISNDLACIMDEPSLRLELSMNDVRAKSVKIEKDEDSDSSIVHIELY